MLPDGAIFKGKSLRSQVTGVGILMWPDSSTYEGQVKKSVPHGQGTKSWANNEDKQNQYKVYNGTWLNGKMEG